MSKKTIAIISILISLLWLAPMANAIDSQKELVFGLLPEENIFIQMRRHKPLAQYLSRELGINVRFTILSRYHQIISDFGSKKLDGAFFGIFTSVMAEDSLEVQPIARPVYINNKSTAKGYLFVRSDSDIEDIRDLEGTRIVYVDKFTATGYLFALSYFREKGIKDMAAFFSEQIFIGSHDNAVYTVLSGQAEVGVAKQRIVEGLSQRDPLIRDELKILAISEDLPDSALYVRKGLPEDIRLKLKTVLTDMNKSSEGRKVLEKFKAIRFIEAKEGDLAPVRALARDAGVSIEKSEQGTE